RTTALLGISVMMDHTQSEARRRNHLPEAVATELAKFERTDSEFRKKDREERAAELHLPLDAINLH
ncbi:hypothetical protein Q5L94_14170, partial [Idiomarina sp. Sol25]|uniref:hypothetical protein n=1 Tax=Idiomarina sp. Sol25 TaxID=3064000 RepID=UPI00294B5667